MVEMFILSCLFGSLIEVFLLVGEIRSPAKDCTLELRFVETRRTGDAFNW